MSRPKKMLPLLGQEPREPEVQKPEAPLGRQTAALTTAALALRRR